MSLPIIVILILIGLIMLVLEVLVIPGIVVGIIGFLLILWGIMSAYSDHNLLTGHVVLIATIIVSIAALVYVLKSKTWNKISLNDNISSKVNVLDDVVEVNDEGVALSRIAPMGKAKIGTQIVEVSTQGDFINENSRIIVFRIEDNKIFVKQLV